ncbi:MAG TPA: enoyl-CoA hydratase-related protein [Polyangiaceae bacterium]|nr:enoyl-CoA hydratase-related protein [Polyangiaceae bacterium]
MENRDYQLIRAVVDGPRITISLNRPERRNALGPQMINELLYALDDALEDAAVRCIVITGEGKAFSAGADFSQVTGGGPASSLEPRGDFKDLLLAIVRSHKPVIARVNGHAMGGGLGLVAACTLAVASLDAKLGTPEIDVGLFPFMIWAVLERLVPRRRLVEMMLTGERIGADEAQRIGLVNRAVPASELDAAVDQYVQALSGKSASTLRLGLEALRDAEALSLEAKLPLLNQRLLTCLATDDAREGLMAFLEKRAPRWSDK